MPGANYSVSTTNIFEAHARNLQGVGGRGVGAGRVEEGTVGWVGRGGMRNMHAGRGQGGRLREEVRDMQQTKHMDVGECAPRTTQDRYK